jgi:hypothetical protein
MNRGFSSLNGKCVHDLERRRQHAGRDYVADGLPGSMRRSEGSQECLHHFRPLDNAQSDFGGDAQSAFRANEDACQVIARCIKRTGTELHQFAAGQYYFQRQDMRDGETVFQAVRSAGVLGDITADGADRL